MSAIAPNSKSVGIPVDESAAYRPYQLAAAISAGLTILGCLAPWVSFELLGVRIDISGISSWYGKALVAGSLVIGACLALRPRSTAFVSVAIAAALLCGGLTVASLWAVGTADANVLGFLGWGYMLSALGMLTQLGLAVWLSLDNELRRSAGLPTA